MKKYIIAIILFICCAVGIYCLAFMGDDKEVINTPVATTPLVTEEPVETPEIVEPEPEKPVISETISVTGENRYEIATMIAKVIYGESRGIYSITEQACIAWTILNRVDDGQGNIANVLTAPNQFYYVSHFPTVDDYGRDLVSLALDVLERWEREHAGETNVGRVLPAGYLWYGGDGKHNWFRDQYRGECNIWYYSLPSPYES